MSEFIYHDADCEDPQAAIEQGLNEAIKAWELRVEQGDADWLNATIFVLDIQEVHMLRDALTGFEGKRQVVLREMFAEYVKESRKHGAYE